MKTLDFLKRKVMSEQLENKIKQLEEELLKRDEIISGLKKALSEAYSELSDFEDEPSMKDSFTATEQIEFRTSGNIIDDQLMDSSAELLDVFTPIRLIEELDKLRERSEKNKLVSTR